MRPQLSLRISGVLYMGLGLMVWSVLWLAPQLGVPLSNTNPKPTDVITSARAWGDINGALFISFGTILILVGAGGSEESAVMKRVLQGNLLVACVLLCFGIFHHVVLHHGPPPPVFLVTISNITVSYLGRTAEADEKKKKKK